MLEPLTHPPDSDYAAFIYLYIFMLIIKNARRSNQSILKEINHEYSREVLMLKLKLQCFGHLMQRADSLEKMLMLGKIEGRKAGGEGGNRG